MPINITIDHNDTSAPGSERSDHSERSSTLSEDEDSTGTGVQVSPASAVGSGSQEYSDLLEETEGWVLAHPDDIGPSDSASRPRTSNQHRPVVEAPHPETARRHTSRRHITQERTASRSLPRTHRRPPPLSSESVDSSEDYTGYARGPPQQHGRPHAHWATVAGGPSPNYPPSFSSGQSYAPFPTPGLGPQGQQIVPVTSPTTSYGYHPPFISGNNASAPGYFNHSHHGGGHMGHPIPPHGSIPYPGQDWTHHAPAPGYFQYPPQAYQIPPAVAAPQIQYSYQGIYSPPLVATPPPQAENSKDDGIARLEKLLIDQRAEQEAKEEAAKKAYEDKLAKIATDKKIADDIAAAAAAAAAAATTEAEKKAAEEKKQVAEEAEKKAAEAEKKAAEEAAILKAAADAAAAAVPPPPPPPPEEKKKPIKFKDAVGRKFSFPFHLCNTWPGMEELIKQAFLHVEVIGPHVADGHYDLVGPNGEIILPQVWETMIEPDWLITMHMWPMPEPPPDPPPAPDAAAAGVPPPPPPPPGGVVVVPDGKKRPRKTTGFAAWTAGRTKTKTVKAKKKPEAPG